ncbi:angiogenic factor with G patch and FHA domains 1 [Cimex lectularius]|uniref:Angiogenic factor with G patch and FHA domains 1 n=1 Tax=Cimex lectularius TaxID=79782 RepID=A0A8I6TFQ7_CIMLE|nr:angiogenic factor with G patch and FHA domains 1 [Cimex lectularius]
MEISKYFDTESIDGDVKFKLRTLLDNLEELKALDELVYYKFLLALCRLSRKTADASTQYEEQTEKASNWGNDIVSEVKAIAEQSVSQSGFVFDRQSGSYYNETEKCFYIPDYKLYYYHQTGAYYYYDEESQSLKFYSSVNLDDVQTYIPKAQASDAKKGESEKEDGECSDSEDQEQKPVVIESGPKSFKPDISKHVAPSIRFIVKTTELKNLPVGKLFILTRLGGTLGREGKHDILIPDRNVSKLHSRFFYSLEDDGFNYKIVDLGSRNGTYIDGVRLSDSLTKSAPTSLNHGNVLTVGCTDLLCHIHEGDKTCSECEPNLVSKKPNIHRNIKEQHQFEQKQLRKKFGLSKGHIDYKADGKYEDRSEHRRKTEGSSHDSEKTEIASVDFAINEKNKGFKLLEKMGWKEGKTLGKEDSKGLLEPINIHPRGKRGLGASQDITDINVVEKSKKGRSKEDILTKTRKRYYNESIDVDPD